MEDNVFDKIHEVDLKDTMEESYINYAMSVIASRALPDVRDVVVSINVRLAVSRKTSAASRRHALRRRLTVPVTHCCTRFISRT